MSCQDSVPKISEQNFPISGMCNKRAFQSGEISNFNDIKRRRLNQGVERIKPRLTTEEIELQKLQKEKEELERQKMQHEKYYHRIKNSRSQASTPSLYSGASRCRNETSKLTNRNDDDMDIDEIAKRPKFKARPMPKSVYTPQFTIKLSDKPLTLPIGFNLSTGNYSSQVTTVKEECTTFKARPLNKNILDKPDFVPQRSYMTPSSSARSNRDTPTPSSFDKSHNRHSSCSTPNQLFNHRSEDRTTLIQQPQNKSFESAIPLESQLGNFQASSLSIFTPPSEPQSSPFKSSSEKPTLQNRTYISNFYDSSFSKSIPNMTEHLQFGKFDSQPMDIEQTTDMQSSIRNKKESYKENSDGITGSSYYPFSSNGNAWSGFKSSNNVKPLMPSNNSQEYDLYTRMCGEECLYSNTEDSKITPIYSSIYDEEMLNSS